MISPRLTPDQLRDIIIERRANRPYQLTRPTRRELPPPGPSLRDRFQEQIDAKRLAEAEREASARAAAAARVRAAAAKPPALTLRQRFFPPAPAPQPQPVCEPEPEPERQPGWLREYALRHAKPAIPEAPVRARNTHWYPDRNPVTNPSLGPVVHLKKVKEHKNNRAAYVQKMAAIYTRRNEDGVA
jgi:hypothetical protein